MHVLIIEQYRYDKFHIGSISEQSAVDPFQTALVRRDGLVCRSFSMHTGDRSLIADFVPSLNPSGDTTKS